ncbi:MAG: AAA family ATPase, partial [Chloroflexi bacterium]|nr:AAA family ATPase [Chloroflexota bacterium]
ELALLTAALDDAIAGRGRLVMLAGEPGIGKTRLARELASRAKESGAQVLWGWCYEGEGAPSYWPWVDSLRTYIQSTEPDLLKIQLGNGAATIGEMIPEVLEILDGVQPAPTMEPDQARFRLFDAITRFLKTASEDSPLLLVIDDLQWADQPSLVLLEFLAQQLDASRILVVGTYRDTEAPPESPLGESLARLARLASFQRRTITGLLPDDVGRFVQSETGITPPEQILNAIHSHTEGNPFFLGEVVRYLAEQGRLDEASEDSSGPGNLGVPPSIRDVIGQRLLRLSEACNRALTTAAVIGREFEFNLLAELTDSTDVGAVLDLMDEAISARIIEDLPGATVRYQFRHSLMQQTLNENISAGRKVRLHADIGEALEKAYGADPGDHTAELAHHFTQAIPLLGNEPMLRYTLMAGERALASYAWEEATQHFLRGLGVRGVDPNSTVSAPDAEAAGLLFGLARAQSANFRLGLDNIQQSASNLRSAFEYYVAAGDSERAVEIAQSPPRMPVGWRGGLMDIMEAALGIAPSGSSAKGHLLANYGWSAGMEEGDYPRADRSFREALEIARENGDGLLLQKTLAQAAQVDLYHDRPQDAIEKSKQVLATPPVDLDLTTECAARYVFCIGADYAGESVGKQDLDAFVTAAERLGNPMWLHFAFLVSEFESRKHGDWENARHFGNRGLMMAPGSPGLLSNMPMTELNTGEFDRAEELLQELLSQLPGTPVSPTFHYPAAAMVSGMSSWFNGSPREPALPSDYTEIALSSPFAVPTYASVANVGLGFDALVRRDKEACQRAYDALAGSTGVFIFVVVVARLLGHLAHELGDVPRAIEHFEDSLAFCAKTGQQPEYAWTCWGLAAVLLERRGDGDRRRAQELLAESLQI